MPFGQSFLLTPLTLNLTRRATFAVSRCFGQSAKDAMTIADEAGIVAASVVATATAIVTLDPTGATLSASYIALEMGEREAREREAGLQGRSV